MQWEIRGHGRESKVKGSERRERERKVEGSVVRSSTAPFSIALLDCSSSTVYFGDNMHITSETSVGSVSRPSYRAKLHRCSEAVHRHASSYPYALRRTWSGKR